MANKRYGLKEVANVIFFDISTGKPALFFDTLKVSTIENESESAEATGGQGNSRLMSWDYSRTASLTMQDALISDTSLAMLSGNSVKSGDQEAIKVVGRETLTVDGTNKITIKNSPVDSSKVAVYSVVKGLITEELSVTVDGVEDTIYEVTGATAGDSVMAFYEYEVSDANASKVTFSGSSFPATYRVVGDTWGRGQDGVDRRMQFVIPQAKLQSTFSLTMDVENVSVFDFNLDVLVEPETNKMYDIITL